MNVGRPLLTGLLAGGALLLAGVAAATAHASTVVHQCGAAVCAVDPEEPTPQPRQLTANGRPPAAPATAHGGAFAVIRK